LINGQRYKLAELGTRIFSPFVIGTDGWALFVAAPWGGVDCAANAARFCRSAARRQEWRMCS
jgi:hypothetical protein